MIDVSVQRKLTLLQKALGNISLSDLSLDAFENLIKELLASQELKPKMERFGVIISVKDGIARVAGMRQIKSGELVRFPHHIQGIVLNLNPSYVDVVILGDYTQLIEGDLVFQTGSVIQVPVGMSLMGRVIDALGRPIDGNGEIAFTDKKPLEASAPGVVDRQPVYRPFQTGIKVIDALIPIGLGQRELIVGDRQTGKTALIVDSIIAQRERNDKAIKKSDKLFCIYVAIGQKTSTVADVVRTLQKYGAMSYTAVVSASASASASLQYLAPFTGCTLGEYFRDNGMHAVVFYDDLSKHANAYRQISLLLKRPPGREAYPGDIFYLHARLLERSAMMSKSKGGGSLTAIPVVETQEGDVSAYIPTNIISITDGQIFLENSLFNEGIRPAVNVGLSVSRVGSRAQCPVLGELSASLKLSLAQYYEMLSFSQISSDLDNSSQSLLKQGVQITEILKQKLHAPLSFEQEIIAIFTVVHGFLSLLDPKDVIMFEEQLQEYIALEYPELLKALSCDAKMVEPIEKELSRVIQDFVESFIEKKNQI